MRRASAAGRLMTTALVVLSGGGFALAQPGDAQTDERRISASATLPESNEALLLSSRVEEAIRQGEFRLAIELIAKFRELPPGLVPAPASRTYYPLWRQAMRLLAQLPPPGVALYRQLYDPEVEAGLARAAEWGDLAGLRELFRAYAISSHWPRIGIELAAQLLDRGIYGEAVEVLRELCSASPQPDPDIESALLVALARAGAWQSAGRVLERLRRQAHSRAAEPLALRAAKLEAWLESARTGRPQGGSAQAGRFEPRLDVGLEWSVLVNHERGAEDWDEDASIAAAVELLRRPPLHRPVLEQDTLLVRVRGAVRAFDAATLAPLWTARELSPGGPEAEGNGALRLLGPRFAHERMGRAGGLEISHDAELLLHDSLCHALSTGFGLVFTIEGQAAEALWPGASPRTFGSVSGRSAVNEIVARDVRTGRVLWRTGGPGTGPLANVAFQDAPLAVGPHLLVPMQCDEDLRLAVLDPSSGRLLREVPIVGPPTRFTPAGGRSLLVADQTSVYVCTGNGVIGALRRDDYQWKWATVYPSTLSEHLGRFFWQPETPRSEPPSAAPILTDELLIVAPVDSAAIIALDRFDGREVWRVPRGQHHVLVGAVAAGLVLANNGLTCLDLADGRTIRWATVPLGLCGRPAIHEEQIFVPTFAGIVEIDGRTGKLVRDPCSQVAGADLDSHVLADPGADTDGLSLGQPSCWTGRASRGAAHRQAAAALAANLIVSAEALFSVSPNRIAKFPDVSRARALYTRRANEQPGEPRFELALAWLDVLESAYLAAFQRLEHLEAPDPGLRGPWDELRVRVCAALAEISGSGPQRLEWLRRAAALVSGPRERANLHASLGRALEESGDVPAALAQYRQMLLVDSDEYLVAFDLGQRLVAGGLVAAERLGRLLPALPSAQVAELIDELERAADGFERGAALLARLLALPLDVRLRSRLEAALLLKRLPPEQAVRYLPPAAPTAWPREDLFDPELLRRLLLVRWETHVSLGMLEAARADRRAWEQSTAGGPVDGPQFEKERARVEGLELALRKLEIAQPGPFTPALTRQWVLPRVELIFDPLQPPGLRSGTVLVRRLEENTIDLVLVSKGTVLRRTEARLENQPVSENPTPLVMGWAPWTSAASNSPWPAVFGEYCAVVHVPGGLVCLGLGPERYAGRRIWERRIPHWWHPPAGFADTAVAGPQGVYFSPRPDRIALIDWFDGRLRWQRDLPGHRVKRLWLGGERVIIATAERELLTVEGASGGDLRQCPAGTSAWRGMEVVGTSERRSGAGATVVVWSGEQIAGLDAATLAPLWSVKDRTIGAWMVASGSEGAAAPVLLYRNPRDGRWAALDVRRGAHLFEAALSNVDVVSAVGIEGGICLVAGAAGLEGEAAGPKFLAAFDLEEGKLLWSTALETLAEINVTQLLAHPEYIPVVLVRARPGQQAPEAQSMELVFVRKREGTVIDQPRGEIGRFFAGAAVGGPVTVLATTGRILVQGFGQLVAFGGPLQ